MESNNQELPPTPPEVDLYAAALRFGFFLRNKLHTDTPAVHMIKDIGFNVQGITERAHEFELKSATMASQLEEMKGYIILPYQANNINTGKAIDAVGTLDGITIYIDPLMIL
jgi:hypothetical protein